MNQLLFFLFCSVFYLGVSTTCEEFQNHKKARSWLGKKYFTEAGLKKKKEFPPFARQQLYTRNANAKSTHNQNRKYPFSFKLCMNMYIKYGSSHYHAILKIGLKIK